MEENKEKLVFSSVRSETQNNNNESPQTIVNRAFQEEQLRQTREIPVQQIKEAFEKSMQENSNQNVEVPIIPKLQTEEIEENATNPLHEVKIDTIKNKNIENNENHILKVKKHMKKSVKITFLLIIILVASFFIILKGYFYMNNPKTITKKSLVYLGEEILSIINPRDQTTLIGDTFSLDSTITAKIESQKVMEEYLNDSKMLEYYYLLNNFNNSKTNIIIKQDVEAKKLFMNRQTIKNNNIVIDDKYLIENSTEYYFVKDYFDKYINDGNNNYFETLTEDKNAIYNIKYLYQMILKTIANCVDDQEYSIISTTTFINDKTANVKKITLKLDNEKLITILNKILDELKKDKTSFNILNGIIENFPKYKISSKKKILDTNQALTINIYASGILNNVKKYDFIIADSKNNKQITYEKDNKTITLLEDNKVKYIISYVKKNNLKATIKDRNNKKLGTFDFDKTNERTHIALDYKDDNKDINLDFNYKITDLKKSSYKGTLTTTIRVKANEKNILNGKITANSTINKKVEIEEEIKDVIFSKEITKEKKDSLSNLLKTRLRKKIS